MIRILFSGDFSDLTFVEVEDINGKSIDIGEWTKEDIYWVLNINANDIKSVKGQGVSTVIKENIK